VPLDDAIVIDVARQRLVLWRDGASVLDVPVSTGERGVGEQRGSGCTPRGHHTVRAKVGAGCVEGAVFVGRRPTGEVYSPALAEAQPARDWILTRILWLGGCEPGRNRGGEVDTLRRYIYIHGCPDEAPMGVAQSHGCIRMRNADVVTLFDAVSLGTSVRIDG
jgi:lipoprotein-anchoring transpeptidase ErfK/SrfK